MQSVYFFDIVCHCSIGHPVVGMRNSRFEGSHSTAYFLLAFPQWPLGAAKDLIGMRID
jgi:hypothetical protein